MLMAGMERDVQPILEVRHLTKYFAVGGVLRPQQVRALEDASFSLRRGQVLALVGESGSGKSTMARLIARLIPPTAGSILYNGQDVLQTEPNRVSLDYRRKVQMIFQDPFSSLNPVHSIRYNLARALQIHKLARSRNEIRRQVHDLLATVGLNPPEQFAAMFPHQLSGGQRQRVAIARALAVEPKVMLADEPVSMLDVSIRIGVLNLMERLKREQGIAFLYITHDIASARYIGDEINVMYAGRLVEGGPSVELIDHPAHPYTQLLLAAVPNPHAGSRPEQAVPRGEMPSLVNPPQECPFAPRCPRAMSVCRETMPDVSFVGPGHWVRCHLYSSQDAVRSD
jgi:peptide/nickel transport system ATP-binding protein